MLINNNKADNRKALERRPRRKNKNTLRITETQATQNDKNTSRRPKMSGQCEKI
jgi:hypothetical protein